MMSLADQSQPRGIRRLSDIPTDSQKIQEVHVGEGDPCVRLRENGVPFRVRPLLGELFTFVCENDCRYLISSLSGKDEVGTQNKKNHILQFLMA